MTDKILIISPYLPWPLNSGGNVGVYYMLSYISQYMKVHFVTSKTSYNNATNLRVLNEKLPNVNFHIYDRLKSGNKRFEILRKVSRKISQLMEYSGPLKSLRLDASTEVTPSYIDFINEIIKTYNINLVQIEFCGYLPFVYSLPYDVKKVFIHHELQFVRNELAFSKYKYGTFFTNYLKDIEIGMLNRFDKVVALTSVDKQKLIEAGVKVPIEVSPLAISNQTYDLRIGKCEPRIAFVGGSVHFPNLDGILWFVSEVLPKILNVEPKFKMQIVGNWSDEAKAKVRKINPDVEFMGFVDDLNEAISNSIMVVPIRIGSGMRMKILEAANYSVPFVSTQVGVEGIDFENGKECFISDCPEDQAQYIIDLYQKPQLYEELSKNVHDKFVNKYSIESLGKQRMSLYSK